MTERIRQWHFQLLLDGSLVAHAKNAPKRFEDERARRWGTLMANAPSAEGALNAFIDAQDLGLAHPVTQGDEGAADDETCRAYRDLRFSKQQAYFELKREEFAMKDEWSEAVAKWTLFTALLLAGAQLVLFLIGLSGTALSHESGTVMSAAALMLVVVSAATRVYRNAIGVTEQRERYESKFVRLVGLRATFEAAPTMRAKREVMRDVELLEVEEMREFLRPMRKASFLL